MGQLSVGPKGLINNIKKHTTASIVKEVSSDMLALRNQLADLETQLAHKQIEYIEKEVKVEIPIEVQKIVEVIKYVDKEVEVVKEVVKEVPVEVIKEVKIVEEKIVEKIKEIEKFVNVLPKWVLGVMTFETLLIIILLIIKLK